MVDFTQREEDLAQCILECLSNKEIAERLGISRSCVIFHLNNMFRKVGVIGGVKEGSRMRLLRWLMAKEIKEASEILELAVKEAQEHFAGAR